MLKLKKTSLILIFALMVCAIGFVGCGVHTGDAKAANTQRKVQDNKQEQCTITVFAAKSLSSVMDEIIAKYNEAYPEVAVVASYDSSGTLLTQIEEGAACDVFFSAAQKQMDILENEDGLVVEGTRVNVVNNQLCVMTYKGSGTKVTGISDLEKAESLAIADGSVPAGKYTREALVSIGVLSADGSAADITTTDLSAALGGVTINECANVGAAVVAIAEGVNEVGTAYYSDIYGHEDRLEVIEKVPYELTGTVIYPAALVTNPEADEIEKEAAEYFIQFLRSAEAAEIFEKYYFDINT